MSDEKTKDYSVFSTINQVEGFDPDPFAVDYVDFNTNEKRKRLPVLVQIAWFRLKHPDGRIACTVAPGKDCFTAHARVYANYMDPPECFLAEGSAARGILPDKPSVSPREWAQTASIGIALRNAGFGLQFGAAGEAFEQEADYELGTTPQPASMPQPVGTPVSAEPAKAPTGSEPPTQPAQDGSPAAALAPEPPDPLQAAMNMPCGIQRYAGKTLGDLARVDPGALSWIIQKSKFEDTVKDAARTIVEHYAQQTA